MEHLYMFAIIPPAELAARIDEERQIFAANYNCVKALKPPVHITLYEPFKTTMNAAVTFEPLHLWAKKQQPFTVELKNFNFFNNPRSPVIYVDVVKSEELTALRKEFLLQLRKYIPMDPASKPSPFKPHFTIGYRDVPPAIFPEIKAAYSKRPFSGSFELNNFHLWKHNGINWQVESTYEFGKRSEQIQSQLF